MGTETQFDSDGTVLFVNDAADMVSDVEVWSSIREQYPELARLEQWSRVTIGGNDTARANVFEQGKYQTPPNFFEELRVAAYAAKYDDIVSGVADTTEQLAFRRVAIEAKDDDQNDIWAQIVDELNIESKLRAIWREQFILSQCYCGILWHRKSYRVLAKNEAGRSKRGMFNNILVPRAITILDPLKVVPVGEFMFGNERLAYIADIEEARAITAKLQSKADGETDSGDLIVTQLIERPYIPGFSERQDLAAITGITSLEGRMFLLNQDSCFRVTATRPDYLRFADVRMASVFELLDAKRILTEMDRTDMLSSTNCIILVKKGSEALPAQKGELQAAKAQMSSSSRMPIIISDHRMEIELITKKTDKTLSPERYNGLNSRITSRLYQILSAGNYSSGTATDNSPGLFKIIASSMEARRDMIRDAIMDNIFDVVWRKNDKFTNRPTMNFYPRRIALDFDANIATFMQDLADRQILSPETLLAEMDILLSEEMDRIVRAEAQYPELVNRYSVPYSPSPNNDAPTPDPKTAGRNMGGTNPDSFKPSPNNRGK